MEANYLAIFVGAIINMIIGSLWFSPIMFGKTWMKLSGIMPGKNDKNMKSKMMKAYIGSFIVSLVMACVLSYFIILANATTFASGALIGLLAGIGFVVTSTASSYLFESKPFKLYLLTVGYYVISYVIIGGILAIWK